jgi:hypothetical protein
MQGKPDFSSVRLRQFLMVSIGERKGWDHFFPWIQGRTDPSQDSQMIADRFGIRPPQTGEGVGVWMLAVFTSSESQVSRPAAQWLEKSFMSGYR